MCRSDELGKTEISCHKGRWQDFISRQRSEGHASEREHQHMEITLALVTCGRTVEVLYHDGLGFFFLCCF